jgi:hypothetical protein
VAEEIAAFVKDRWVAIEGSYEGKRVFIRHYKEKPLTIQAPLEVSAAISRYSRLNARTIYATIHVYKSISGRDSVDDPSNIAMTTPFIDIDGSLENYRVVLEAARVIVDYLEKHGVSKSVYILWSGEGAHVRINERAFSSELLSRYHPLIVAYSVVEYVLRNVKEKLDQVVKANSLKVENLVDIKRVFTAPLSLHRQRDVVAITFKPRDIDSFDPSWVDPRRYRHGPSAWRSYEEGEADNLALEALRSVASIKLLHTKLGVERRQARPRVASRSCGIGRFQVMALLQAARYYLLYGDLERAKSFGLNRAIFYAWAKHYGRGYVPRYTRRAQLEIAGVEGLQLESATTTESKRLVEATGEEAFVSPRGFFVMGDKEQLPEDYDKNVAAKIEEVIPYELAWEAALKYVSKFPRQVLEDPSKFFERVYEPVRDHFIELVIKELADEETKKSEEKSQEQKPRPHVTKTYGLYKWMKRDQEGKPEA